MRSIDVLKISGERPRNFHGSLYLPPSKSYLHRALFCASLCAGESKINIGTKSNLSDDIKATMHFLSRLGVRINRNGNVIRIISGEFSGSRKPISVAGSGTTARFGISLAALAGYGNVTAIAGDSSLSSRPMQPLLDALLQLGVKCKSRNGKLPVEVEGGGITGGSCVVDGSVSSQFVSSLLIACTRAKRDCIIKIANPSRTVSEPYIDATLYVLKDFGFEIKANGSKTEFQVRGNQIARSGSFRVPGDMSSGASLIACAIACRGKIFLHNAWKNIPQADSAFLGVARKFGAQMTRSKDNLCVVSRGKKMERTILKLDMMHSPDIVPLVAGLAAASGVKLLRITNVGHLRFKESDRLSIISRELNKLGVRVKETKSSLTIFASRLKEETSHRKPILLDPEGDHRIMMTLTAAGLSGRFGEVLISDPSCVRKSYPNFVSDVQMLLHSWRFMEITRRRE